ncbi:hypothetical protein T09_14609 [Trichinella sp. T9]|nr:hypothetical protein T09_14609 [Trichinella sp. T9]
METYIVEDIIQESETCKRRQCGYCRRRKRTCVSGLNTAVYGGDECETCKRRQCGYCRRRKRTCVSGLNTAVYGGDECGECAFLLL